LGFEEQLLASQPFVFSRSPERVAHVGHPVRRIVRYTEERKAAIAESDERKRRYQESLKAQRRMARLAKLSESSNQDQDPSSSSAAAQASIDPSELRQILNAFEPFIENDHERDELILLTTHHLQGLPGATPLFLQFTRMLRSRRR
jgi:hypothetical protein